MGMLFTQVFTTTLLQGSGNVSRKIHFLVQSNKLILAKPCMYVYVVALLFVCGKSASKIQTIIVFNVQDQPKLPPLNFNCDLHPREQVHVS